jgi:hypothetical protein
MGLDYGSNLLSDSVRLDAWSRLAAPVSGLCYAVARRLEVPSDRVFDSAVKYLGFSGQNGFLRGLHQAARAHLVCNRILCGTKTCPSDDFEYVLALSEKLRANDIRALEMPYKPKVRISDVEVEGDEDSMEICEEVLEALESLRSDILYGFTSRPDVLSPQAVNHARAVAAALAGESGPGVIELEETAVWQAIAEVRFEDLTIVGLGVTDDGGDPAPAWSRQDRARHEGTVLEATQKLRDAHQGYVPNVTLRRMLEYRPCVGNDSAWEKAPPLYTAMSYAPEHARFNIEFTDECPVIFGEIYVRSLNDISDVLMGSVRFPDGVNAVSSAEADYEGAPSLAGWLKVYWE